MGVRNGGADWRELGVARGAEANHPGVCDGVVCDFGLDGGAVWAGAGKAPAASAAEDWPAAGAVSQGTLDERLVRVERSMVSLLHVLRKVVAAPANLPQMDNIE